tara:strand:+ start:275 stop:574 length:300 start_codon:yes stop_codon:yes gene_type:complete
MSRARNTSASERLMVDVLRDAAEALTLDEIVEQILDRSPATLGGRTPKKSLYSVIYRKEKRREERGLPVLFKTSTRGGAKYYSINAKGLEHIGERTEFK